MTPVSWIVIGIIGLTLFVVAAVYLIVPLFKGIAWLLTSAAQGVVWMFTHLFKFVVGMVGDVLRAIGGLITAIIFVPLVLANIVIGRWSAAGHYGRALKDEISGVGHCLYRAFVGHPARFLLLHGLVEGIEQRIPDAVAKAPGADRPSGRTGQFEGYTIVGSLQGGGSGGRLYVAEPDDRKHAAFAKAGRTVRQVVIKSFSLGDGSSLPQIIRESRALEAAKKLGLILDHELTDTRFYYVMEFIPGDALSVVTKRLHAESGADGLGERQLIPALSMIGDLLTELGRYHTGGLWHKDVKPDNIIINQGRAHLVDLGLITPLRSAMTLTTHGTEYFRDPEMVRMALRGAKVNEVDGVKFDLYGVGAVLYSVIENSFPAHGGLSQITKQCPEALRWIVRRAMTDLHSRYNSAGEMFSDLRTLITAADPFAMRPADLPSVMGGAAEPPPLPEEARVVAAAGSPAARLAPPVDSESDRRKPKIGVTDWWSGRYDAKAPNNHGRGFDPMQGFDPGRVREDAARVARDAVAAAAAGMDEARRALGIAPARRRADPDQGHRRTAAEMLSSAQSRVRTAQARAAKRGSRGAMATSFARGGKFSSEPNAGVVAAFFVFLGAAALGAVLVVGFGLKQNSAPRSQAVAAADDISIKIGDREFALGSIDREWGNIEEGFSAMGQDLARGFRESENEMQRRFQKSFAFKSGDPADEARSGSSFSEQIKHELRSADPAEDENLQRANEAIEALSRFKDGLRSLFRGRRAGEGSAVIAHSAAVAEAPPEAWNGTVLLLNMLPVNLEEVESSHIALMQERLESSGFEFIGLGGTSAETEKIAQARHEIGLSHPDDTDAIQRLQDWVNDADTGIDAVLWIGEGQSKGEVERRIIVRESCDEGWLMAVLRGPTAP